MIHRFSQNKGVDIVTKQAIIKQKSHYEILSILSIISIVFGFVMFLPFPPFGFVFFLGGGLAQGIILSKFKKVSTAFKSRHVKEEILKIVEGGTYEPTKGFLKEEVYGAKLLKKEDRFHSEDMITGVISGKKFRCADLHLQDVRSSGKSTTVVTIFKGKYYEIELGKTQDSFVYIVNNATFGFGKKDGMSKIELEWIAFNQAFDVYGHDDLETFKLLKPAFTEKIYSLKLKYKKIEFGFIGKKLVIAINNGKDAFDLRMFKPFNDDFTEEIKQELTDLKEIIETLAI